MGVQEESIEEAAVEVVEQAGEAAPAMAMSTDSASSAEDETTQPLAGTVQAEAESMAVGAETEMESGVVTEDDAEVDDAGTSETSAPVVVTLSTTEGVAAVVTEATVPAPRPQPTSTVVARVLPTQVPVGAALELPIQENRDSEAATGNNTVGIVALVTGTLTLIASAWLWWRRR